MGAYHEPLLSLGLENTNRWTLTGIIKGSELALERPEGYLTKETYNGLSTRTQGTFATQRETVYMLFEAYVKQKKARGDYDAADR